MSLVGGCSDPRPATPEDQDIANKVKGQFETQSGTQTGEFTVTQVKAQVVAGTKYWMEVRIGNDSYVHLQVYDPLPGTNEGPTLESYKLNMKQGEKLGDC